MNAIRLKTEYLKHPIGMDIVKPQLFWNCVEGGVLQTAYRIVCRDEHENLLWDSGRVESSSIQAVYAGVLIPWDIYAAYGDRRILEENYAAMCRYTRFKIGTLGKWYMTSLPPALDRAIARISPTMASPTASGPSRRTSRHLPSRNSSALIQRKPPLTSCT